jgi:small subunit ribosomal protein S17
VLSLEYKLDGVIMAKTVKENTCTDKKCPFHGSTRLRGLVLEGTIVKTDTHRSATFEKERRLYVRKFERYEKRKTRLHVHNPPCINAKKGDHVRIMECKPLSKTKHFVIIKNIGHDILFAQKEEALEESKVRSKRKEITDEATEIKETTRAKENVQERASEKGKKV